MLTFKRVPYVAACLGAGLVVTSAQGTGHKDVLEPPERLVAWLEDVQAHTPGAVDSAAMEVARWPRSDLDLLAVDIRRLSAFYFKFHSEKSRTFQLLDRKFTIEELERTFHGNTTLLRGAFLHSDIAMYVADDVSGRDPERTFAVDDGRGQGARHQTGHWRMGRLVLEAVAPSPMDDGAVLLWYRATTAYLLREGHFGEATAHLARAAQLFPSSPDVSLDNALMREKFGSPEIQAAVQDYKVRGVTLSVESDRTEWGRAERFLRQTLALDPERLEARIRLGRVLGDLGRHQDAGAELRQALAARPEGELRYFAELFLGREEEALGNRETARAHFAAAAQLFPQAQSPYLALGQLARLSGDRAAAQRHLQEVAALPADELARRDPWWSYYTFHADDVDVLMDAARDRVFAGAQ